MAQIVKNLAALQETWVRSLGQEDSLENLGNGNPLQYSCLENPVDREAWQATVHGVEKELDTTEGGWQSEISVCDTSKHQGDCTRATLLVIW